MRSGTSTPSPKLVRLSFTEDVEGMEIDLAPRRSVKTNASPTATGSNSDKEDKKKKCHWCLCLCGSRKSKQQSEPPTVNLPQMDES